MRKPIKDWDELEYEEKLVLMRFYPEEAKEMLRDEYSQVRLEAGQQLGFTPEMLEDRHCLVRLEAGKQLGFTPEMLEDECWSVRLAAGKQLGFTFQMLGDPDLDVRKAAVTYFKLTKEEEEDTIELNGKLYKRIE